MLMQVSEPSSSLYGQYWTKEQVDEYLAADRIHFMKIFEWLKLHEITTFNVISERFVKVQTTIEKAEKLLSTEFLTLVHKETGMKINRSINGYFVPKQIAELIQIVGGVIRIPS